MSTLALVMYSYAVIGMEAFNGILDYKDHPIENFNTFGHSLLSLFQCLIINNWNDLLTGCIAGLAHTLGHAGAVYLPALYFLSFLGLECVIVANVIAAVFLTIFNLHQERLTLKAAVANQNQGGYLAAVNGGHAPKFAGLGELGEGERAAMMWGQSVERLMLEAIIEEERDDIEKLEQETLLRLWRLSRPIGLEEDSQMSEARDRAVEHEFVVGRDKLVQAVRRKLGDEDEALNYNHGERGQYVREAHRRLYSEELKAPRHWYDVEV